MHNVPGFFKRKEEKSGRNQIPGSSPEVKKVDDDLK